MMLPYFFLGLAVFLNLLLLLSNEYVKKYIKHYHYDVWTNFEFPDDNWPLVNSHSFKKSGADRSRKISAGSSRYIRYLKSQEYKSLHDRVLNNLVGRMYKIYVCMIVSIVFIVVSAGWTTLSNLV